MEQTVYGFHYDYIRHRGTCLVLSGAEPFGYDALERIESRMLEANDIPGLLPFEVEEIDLKVRLRFDITGKKMLSQWMKTGRLTLAAYYRVLLGCAGTIDDSKAYMLREEGYWLHENFIFAADDIADGMSLLYVPVREADGKPPVREQFRELALRLSACIDHIEGNGFSTLLGALHRDRFEFHDIRKLLGGLLHPEAEPDGERKRQPALERTWNEAPGGKTNETARSAPSAGEEELLRQKAAAEEKWRFELPSWIGSGSAPAPFPARAERVGDPSDVPRSDPFFLSDPAPPSFEAENPVGPGEPEPASGKRKWLGGAVVGAAALLLWSFYPSDAPEGAFSVWSGLTILLLDGLFVSIRIRPEPSATGRWSSLAQTYKEMEEREMTGLTGWLPGKPRAGTTDKPPVPETASERTEAADWKPFVFSRQANKENANTTLLQDATVLLRPDAGQPGESGTERADFRHLPMLEINKGGAAERIPLVGETFLVGRERGAVDYADETAGVSKLHLEIAKDRSDYFAKDLGSKNGTLRNNEPMVPYKRYALSDGDTLQIVNTRFVFRTNAPDEAS